MQRHSQNRFTPSFLGAGLVALAALTLLGTGAAWGQPYGQFKTDGAMQTAGGGWTMPYEDCTEDYLLAGFTDQASCEGAGWVWAPESGTCVYTRYDCRQVVVFGVWVEGPGPDLSGVTAYDTEAECDGSDRRWRTSDQCNLYGFSNQTDCVNGGGTWYTTGGPDVPPGLCAGDYYIDLVKFPHLAGIGSRDECNRCHNARHYPTWYNDRGVGEAQAMTGHKNMLRPVDPGLNPSPYYTPGFPWAGSDGTIYPSDSNGRVINWSTGQIDSGTDGIADTDLFWIYDGWIGDLPRSHFGTGDYNCGRCHSTGWTPDSHPVDKLTKQPYLMFNDRDPGGLVDGTWDQWGIQCARCHGSRKTANSDGDSDGELLTPEGNLEHHPNVEPGKQVTTENYPNEEWCVADGWTWDDGNDECETPFNETECDDAGHDWDAGDVMCYAQMIADGATRTNLCMDCHRQESGGNHMDLVDPGTDLKVGNAHGHLGFLSHWHGNLFLNSPHGRFGGTSDDIGDNSQYDTHFKYYGGGCTGCHNVHESTVDAANPDGGAFKEKCTDCHSKDLATMRHPWSKNTPLENAVTDPMESCEICHMPEALHLFRISVDPSYDTYPLAAYTGGTHDANTADEEGFDAVWVDLDMACGQCHGGGSEYVLTSGDITSGEADLTVPAGEGVRFAIGDPVEVHGAGGGGSDLHSFVSNVVGDVVTLYNTAGTTVEGAQVQQNPTNGNAGYISKERLAVLAEGIHGDTPVANFTYALDGADTLTVNVSASLSSCSGAYANCNQFDWDWGDGTTSSGDPASHTYAAPGKKTITLTVTQYSHKPGIKSKVVNTYATDFPPVISAECSWDANTWTMTVTDTGSTDDLGIAQGAVTWGDGSLTSVQSPPTVPFVHTYLVPGVFMVQYKIIDSIGQQASFVCPPETMATPAYFTIAGVVHATDHSTTLQGVRMVVLDGGTVVKTVYTDAAGAFTVGNLRPGTYTLFPIKSGYGFTTTDVAVGPSDLAVDIDATSDPRLAPKGNNGKKPDKPAKSSRVKGF